MGYNYNFAFLQSDIDGLKPVEVENRPKHGFSSRHTIVTTDGHTLRRTGETYYTPVVRDGKKLPTGVRAENLLPGDQFTDYDHSRTPVTVATRTREVIPWAVTSPAIQDPEVTVYLHPNVADKVTAYFDRLSYQYAPAPDQPTPDINPEFTRPIVTRRSTALILHRRDCLDVPLELKKDFDWNI